MPQFTGFGNGSLLFQFLECFWIGSVFIDRDHARRLCWLLPSLRRILLPLLRFLYEVSSSSLPRRGIPLGTSVREIGMVHAIERAPLPRHVRGEYNSTKAILLIRAGKGLFSRRRGSIRAFCVYLDQATSMCQLSRAPRTFFALDQTTDNLHCAWNVRRSDERKVRTACGKRPVTTPTDHPTSTMNRSPRTGLSAFSR